MRYCILGADGQMGRELEQYGRQHGHDVVAMRHGDCDVTDAAAVERAVTAQPWDAVINCAAYTKVDLAESEADTADAVNAKAPRFIAQACRAVGVRLVHLSTDFVFDGSGSEPIPETAQPHPLSVYGATKLAGERAVLAALPSALVVRTSWLYGQQGPNFVLTMLRLARQQGRLRVVADQWGSPTWTGHLAPALLHLLDRGAEGTYHLSNSGSTTWHGFAVEVLRRAGVDAEVEAIATAEYPTAARRPAYSVLDNARWRADGEPELADWRDGLAAYLAFRPAPD